MSPHGAGGGQSLRKEWQHWDSIQVRGPSCPARQPTSPTNRTLDMTLPPVLMTPVARTRHAPGAPARATPLSGEGTAGVSAETPLRSCVILRKPQTLFPTVKQIIVSSPLPSPGHAEPLIKPVPFTSEPQVTQVWEGEAQCAPCLGPTVDSRFDIQQPPC